MSEFNFNEHAESINLVEFDNMCAAVFEQDAVCETIKKQLASEERKLKELEDAVLAILDKTGKEKYPIQGRGVVSVRRRYSISMPKDPVQKKAFFDYLRGRGIFEDLTTVNSQTLNSFYKQEMEAAVSAQNPDFKIPGLAEPFLIKTLGLTKK